MQEFTGTYYKCNKCSHIWDYSDSHCPNCGSQDETELNAKEVKEIALQMIAEGNAAIAMLKVHDDLGTKKNEVFSRDECVFHYCPHPEKCQDKCITR